MRKSVFVFFLLLIVTVGVQLEYSSHAVAVEKGAKAPNFAIGSSVDSKAVKDLQSLRGRVVVIDFWAPWCKPCKKELPVLQKLYTDYKAKGVVVVGVNVDEDAAKMQKFLADLAKKDSMKITFPMVIDKGGTIAPKYDPSTMPSSFVIDQKGRIHHVQSGFRGGVRSGDGLVLENAVRGLLGLAAIPAK